MFNDILGKNFKCKNCGTNFTDSERFCPKCLKNKNLNLFGYCHQCNRITEHEDIIENDIKYICTECGYIK